MKELKELIKFLLGFMPWILFLFLAGHTLAGLEKAVVVSLAASLVFGFRELRKGFILQWGTLLFFLMCMITVNFLKLIVVAEHMGVISNGFLMIIIWSSILTGRPFTLQYARSEIPEERWYDPELVAGCRFIAVFWGVLLGLGTLVQAFKILRPGMYPDWIYFDISIGIILTGIIFTTLYKKRKRS